MRLTRTTIPPLAGVLAAATLAGSAMAQPVDSSVHGRHAESTIARSQDLRSPDARDGATGGTTRAADAWTRHSLTPPDVRDSSSFSGTSSVPREDLRSPDSRDAANGRGTFNAPGVTVIKLPQSGSVQHGGIDWADAAIGAGGLLAILLAGAITVRRRHSDRRATAVSY